MDTRCTGVFEDQYSRSVGTIVRAQSHYFYDTVRQIIGTSVISRNETFTVGDYGCHDGSSSQDIVEYLLGALRKLHGEDLTVHIIYEDGTNNDYNALVKNVSRNGRESGNQKVFVSMCPTSFYRQCLPDDTFNIVVCFWSAHFLPRSVSYKDSLSKFPDGSRSECDAVADLASEAWQGFLLIRANEIKSGGCMLLVVPAEDTERKYGESSVHLQNLWVAMTTVWRLLRDMQHVTQREYEAANYSGYYRSEDELRAPFLDEDSPVVKAGLRIESLLIQHERIHIMSQRRKEETGNTENLTGFVPKFVSAIRSWTEYMFRQALSSRSSESRRHLINSFYDLLVEHIKQQDMYTSEWDNIIAYVVIMKK
ncbi:uncharacterized protein [Haliotis asinina]|uniref:uncharacterized protein n=1 Tax=Haliotis asinina TaxID=109174 RepID=UPI003531B6DA